MGAMWIRVCALTLGLAICQSTAFAGGEKTYLDHRMEVVDKERHAMFYRTSEPAGDKGYKVKAFFLSGELKMEGYYKDKAISVPHGEFTFYYKNGQVESTGDYADGLKTGVWQRYAKDGSEKAEKVYENYYHTIVVTDPDKMPSFPGGDEAMNKYLSENLIYPEEAKSNGEMGKVMLEFVVAHDGNVKSVEVAEGASASLNVEAVRVISEMPKWNPGQLEGHNVNVRLQMPVEFKL